jgi:hypothetical protein
LPFPLHSKLVTSKEVELLEECGVVNVCVFIIRRFLKLASIDVVGEVNC